jgi:hypothetical protein
MAPSSEGDSEQENICRDFMHTAAGASFLFWPDSYGKNLEPADLAWACDNVIVLFWMTARKSFEASISHNLEQAAEWLRAWRAGQALAGKNDERPFSIPYGNDLQIAVVSVVKSKNQRATYHRNWAARHAVSCCATITQDQFAEFATSGGSLLDLVLIIDSLEMKLDNGDEGMIERYRRMSRGLAAERLSVDGKEFRPSLMDLMMQVMARMRTAGNDPEYVPFFTDFAMCEMLLVGFIGAELWEMIKVSPRSAAVTRGVPHKTIPIRVTAATDFGVLLQDPKRVSAPTPSNRGALSMTLLRIPGFFDRDAFETTVVTKPRTGMSRTAELLLAMTSRRLAPLQRQVQVHAKGGGAVP